tara:strand:- start:614 stop:1186 length:573 start_codon:yes stop_codon:yes gene_type:complete
MPIGQAKFGLLGLKVEDLGKLELITTQTASSDTSLDILSIQETTYNIHLLVLSDITVSVNGAGIFIRTWYGGTPTLATSGYTNANTKIAEDQTLSNPNATASMIAIHNIGSDAGQSGAASFWLYAAGNSSEDTYANYHYVSQSSGDQTITQYGGARHDLTTNVNGIRILVGSSATFSGNVSLYGYSESSS